MYGLLLENMAVYVRATFGEAKWKEIREALKISQEEFVFNHVFPEGQLVKMGKKALNVLGVKDEEFYEGMGRAFIGLTTQLGYGKYLSNLGRHIRDFLLNLDNFHDYLKFSFPRMKPPSFFVENETQNSLHLQYRSKRRGFHFYVQGQAEPLKEIATSYYGQQLEIKLRKQEVVFDTVICSFDLTFDNSAYIEWTQSMLKRKEASLPIRASVLFQMFPFCILFQKDLTVTSMGVALQQVIPQMVGKKLTVFFELIKPLIEFKFEMIETRSNNIFELATSEEIDKLGQSNRSSTEGRFTDEIRLEEDVDKTLHLKGQMIKMTEWGQMLFLCSPMLNSLNGLIWTGLFVNDLSMHDYSRDIMLATSQEQIELRMALNAAEVKAQQLNSQLQKLDQLQAKTDQLLYQMIPKSVAARLRQGESAMATVEVFPSVTMLFSDIVGFTTICSRLQPVQVVVFLNNLYTLFDFLVDQNAVYKVVTIGDAYFLVAGCPQKATNHALKICDMAFDMMDGIDMMRDPGTGDPVRMRIGCHSGSVVAAVVGLKVPRYCLFGLDMELTEKLESSSQPMRIHVSQACKELLPPMYRTEERLDDPDLTKKIGGLRSYFLVSKDGRKPLQKAVLKALLPTDAEAPRIEHKNQATDLESPMSPGAPVSSPKNHVAENPEKKVEQPRKTEMDTDESESDDEETQRRASAVNAPYCGGFQNSAVCNLL